MERGRGNRGGRGWERGGRGRGSRGGDRGWRGRGRGGTTNNSEASGRGSSGPPVPRNVCKFFWETGNCIRGFSCRFAHETAPGVEPAQLREVPNSANRAEDAETPYSSDAHLDSMQGAGSDAFREGDASYLNPQETQSHLRRYLRDGYIFGTPAQRAAFSRLVKNATSTNSTWSDEDGQLFLTTIASDNGRLLLAQMLSYTPVSASERGLDKLSFLDGYLPLFQYLTSKFVVKSTLHHHTNSLFALVDNNIERVIGNLTNCLGEYMAARTFVISLSQGPSSGISIFVPIVETFFEVRYMTRFKNVVAQHECVGAFIHQLAQWIDVWAFGAQGPASITSNSMDPRLDALDRNRREFIVNHIKRRINLCVSIVSRESSAVEQTTQQRIDRENVAKEASQEKDQLFMLQAYYTGPGELREGGRRHDNDFVSIQDIKVAPTDGELLCHIPPFLPANIPNGPHPLPADSMGRLLDIQFRLLREELLAPLRISVQVAREDLLAQNFHTTQLAGIKKKKGGRYNHQDKHDSVMFGVYTNIEFGKIEMDSRRGLVVEVKLDTPPGSARSTGPASRASYWLGPGSKRLVNGGLIAILWKSECRVDVHLGAMATTNEKIAESSRSSADKLAVRVQFFDSAVNSKILDFKRTKQKPRSDIYLIESSVMFESIRPFLDSLRRVPETVPFHKYLPHPTSGSLAGVEVHPPFYSILPEFSFELRSLLRPDRVDEERSLRLNASDAGSVITVRRQLKDSSRLDPSQADSLIDALTQEVSLIQGPPGTGKTFMGVELIRILVENGVGPIVLIAFTNHALDHMLLSIINNNITKDIARLGGRTSEEAIKAFSIEELERMAGRSFFERALKSEHAKLKETEEQVMKVLGRVIGTSVPSHVLLAHLQLAYPDHIESLQDPPKWISTLHELNKESMGGDSWRTVGRREEEKEPDRSLYAFWKNAHDLAALHLYSAPEKTSGEQGVRVDGESGTSENEEIELLNDVFVLSGLTSLPKAPESDRPLEQLLEPDMFDIWNLSACERKRLHEHWLQDYRDTKYETHRERLDSLLTQHETFRNKQQERNEAVRLNILRNKKIIGCTTTGAAKLVSLLRSLGPRVMIVEEAGQVLEAHVLGSLVDSVQHLVLIGDPLQLRPSLNNFELSMENKYGQKFYKFDMSLMERLSTTKFPMSRLDVQRRMRPEVSTLIRDTLYHSLEDHELVTKYPHVRGMGSDVFFFNHFNKENGGGDDTVSKHNMFEVDMIRDLVKYLLRQGCYSNEGNIVVLCAYLGQLMKVRDALKKEMTVVIDERDQAELDKHEEDEGGSGADINIERVQITQRVKIRSIDNYQGEEADVVILSLVRNSGQGDTEGKGFSRQRSSPRIGFLKSNNRTNVAISRARHGLYILGNAHDLSAQSGMWGTIIEKLDAEGAVSTALPIKCHRHPTDIRHVSKPGQLPTLSPDGGCLLSCDYRLDCGHVCSYKCHSDDRDHRNVFCLQPCSRLCSRGHPCSNKCGKKPCGECKHPVFNVLLPCGHIKDKVECHVLDDLSAVKCSVSVERELKSCEHKVVLPCSSDVSKHRCERRCDGILACCGHRCAAKCHMCQDNPNGQERKPRTRHNSHVCGKPLFCQHSCAGTCSADHKCLDACRQLCRQRCSHTSCAKKCSEPCAPCLEPCDWKCPHLACQVPCGSVCSRLPCDRRCENVLGCGHRCPSVCGENCAEQLCLECGSEDQLGAIGDFVMHRTLKELDPSQETLEEMTITLPVCRHTFTVETLDGHCRMSEHYQVDGDGKYVGLIPQQTSAELRKPPTCPTCRRAIRCPRFGRVYKRADLDILERNIAFSMSRNLSVAREIFDGAGVSDLQDTLVSGITSLECTDATGADEGAKTKLIEDKAKVLDSGRRVPITWRDMDPRNKLHAIHSVATGKWMQATRQLREAYYKAWAVQDTDSAHGMAWEASFAKFYRLEMESYIEKPEIAPRRPEEHAMRVAKMKVGQHRPLADKRYHVEAIWLMLDIRFRMIDLADVWLNPTGARSVSFTVTQAFKEKWQEYVSFLIDSCEKDSNLALDIAEDSGSQRQALRSRTLILRCRQDRFKLEMSIRRNRGTTPKDREELLEELHQEMQILADVVAREGPERRETARMSAGDYQKFFSLPCDAIDKGWKDIKEALERNEFHAPPSDEELIKIIAALTEQEPGLHYSGHFYDCPNGHAFVIGDCGGAMERAFCPECGEEIGGQGHELLGTNRRNRRLEDLARANGGERSPWAWNRDA